MKKVTSLAPSTKLAFALVITLSSIVALPAMLSAQAPVVPSAPAGQSAVADQCQKVTEKVDLKISNYSEAHSNFDTRAGAVIEKLKTVSGKLAARGVDTSALDASITTLETKRTKLAADKQAFISKLQESKQFTCGASQGQFKSKVTEAKTLQKAVVVSSKDIQSAAKTIRDTVKALRASVASSTQAI